MNDIIQFLRNRNSVPRLQAPAPDAEQLKAICETALTAPDHKLLKPWKYLIVEGDSRHQLGELMVQANKLAGVAMDDEQQQKLAAKPLRAPLIIIAICDYKVHEKVPEIEQVASVAAGVENMLLAAESLGFGGYWRTGKLAFNRHLHQLLGLSDSQQILGFIYLGTAERELKPKTRPEMDEFFSHWPE